MEDPFPDHHDPDEEAISPSKRLTNGQTSNNNNSSLE